LGSSSNMGRVVDTSFLCLDCKRKESRRQRRRDELTSVWGLIAGKLNKRGANLEITYSPLCGGGHKRRRGLSLATLCPTGRRSIHRQPWSSEHRFGGDGAYVGMGTSRRRQRAP